MPVLPCAGLVSHLHQRNIDKPDAHISEGVSGGTRNLHVA